MMPRRSVPVIRREPFGGMALLPALTLILALVVGVVGATAVRGAEDFGQPESGRAIYDRSGLLTAAEVRDLETRAAAVVRVGAIGEQPTRDGLLDTPERARKSMAFQSDGYDRVPREVPSGAIFREPYDEMILVKDIERYSLCERHLLPFFGRVQIA